MLSKSRASSLFIFILCFIFILHTFVGGAHRQRRYVPVRQKETWSAAQNYCRENYNDLATFRSKVELDRGSRTCHDKCWIGLQRDKHDPNDWKWSDGEKTSFTCWSSIYEPNNSHGKENCVFTKVGLWYDMQCDYKSEFLCYEDHLILVKENKTWEEALEHCRTLDTDPNSDNRYFNHLYDLPHMHLGDFNWKARKMIQDAQTEEVWIGLRFLAGRWLWVNRERLERQLPTCPATGMYCGIMSKTGDLFPEKNCLERRNFLCSTT